MYNIKKILVRGPVSILFVLVALRMTDYFIFIYLILRLDKRSDNVLHNKTFLIFRLYSEYIS